LIEDFNIWLFFLRAVPTHPWDTEASIFLALGHSLFASLVSMSANTLALILVSSATDLNRRRFAVLNVFCIFVAVLDPLLMVLYALSIRDILYLWSIISIQLLVVTGINTCLIIVLSISLYRAVQAGVQFSSYSTVAIEIVVLHAFSVLIAILEFLNNNWHIPMPMTLWLLLYAGRYVAEYHFVAKGTKDSDDSHATAQKPHLRSQMSVRSQLGHHQDHPEASGKAHLKQPVKIDAVVNNDKVGRDLGNSGKDLGNSGKASTIFMDALDELDISLDRPGSLDRLSPEGGLQHTVSYDPI